MCCLRSKLAKIFTTVFSVLTALGGLVLIGICFKLILDTDSVFNSSNTGNFSSDNPERGLDEISKRISIIAFIIGACAVVFGLLGICTAKL